MRRIDVRDSRGRAIAAALVLSWAGSLVLAIGLLGSDPSPTVRLTIAGLVGGLAVLTLLPWTRLLSNRSGEVFIAAWCVGTIVILMLAFTGGSPELLALGLLVVVSFAAAVIVSDLLLTAIAGSALIVYTLASASAATSSTGVVSGVLVFAAIAMFLILLSEGTHGALKKSSLRLRHIRRRERELREQERELNGLYEVSRTIGEGSNLTDVLPELVGRVARAVEAKVGVILLFRPDDEALLVMSPIWAAGHTIGAEGYSLALSDPGLAQRVFVSGDPAIDNEIGETRGEDRFIDDLDSHRIAAVPLQIHTRRIGVLLVADKGDPFVDEDLSILESLAAPASLVLNQLARYEAVRASEERMAEVARLKTDFVSVVSHELRTPLTTILGSLSTLQRPELEPPDTSAQELIKTATRQANRLRGLIEDLLVVSRLDAEATPVRIQPLAVGPFLDGLIADIPQAAGRVTVAVAPQMSKVEADPDHLTRIVANLVENALKYGGDAPIEVVTKMVGSEARISVVDHGGGIPYELRDHIFDRFTQVQHHQTRSRGGSGLGLSIVKGLSEAMGGRVWLEPTIGGGATFSVALPASTVSTASAR